MLHDNPPCKIWKARRLFSGNTPVSPMQPSVSQALKPYNPFNLTPINLFVKFLCEKDEGKNSGPGGEQTELHISFQYDLSLTAKWPWSVHGGQALWRHTRPVTLLLSPHLRGPPLTQEQPRQWAL